MLSHFLARKVKVDQGRVFRPSLFRGHIVSWGGRSVLHAMAAGSREGAPDDHFLIVRSRRPRRARRFCALALQREAAYWGAIAPVSRA
jgi:hypothetical protein